ncbi:MAG: cell division protease FtsH [Solirubrobacteraceae bacterium]|jgi:ATP-dependent Zn protease|nr:cell division protease FtsH [Solirubrobacteraceae bacterium]
MTDETVYARSAAERNASLGQEWKRLSRAATFVAILTGPAFFAILVTRDHMAAGWALLLTVGAIAAFRGLIDILAHRLIPRPSLYGAGREALLDDATARRRLWFWRGKYRLAVWLVLIVGSIMLAFGTTPGKIWSGIGDLASQNPQLLIILLQLPLLFFINFAIIFGPLLVFSVKQMKGYEPGDADWGVKLSDVRGQTEPKEEVTRVITLWQGGEEFRKAGGKPERGLLFIGAPGTGKTMLSKAIATSFNSPIVTMPGSGFAGMFMGMDVITVLMLIRKARKLARKWGGQCIIFIDEIDAVGLRRAALGGGGTAGAFSPAGTPSFEDFAFHGPWGAQTASGDLILETTAWRERLFANRAPNPVPIMPPALANLYGKLNSFIFPGAMGGMGGMGGGMALNQLLIQMDGVDEPPFWRKFWTNRINNVLDATYLIPSRIGERRLRLPKAKPRTEQIYFVGATNVPIDRLDPALVRPGRMGRHIWFRTPTKDDRKDIFDLYLARVDHDPDLDSDKRRDELARITNGYSPAMIEQVCSMALTLAHSDAREVFGWPDIVEAMTTIESGTAQGVDYVPDETRAVAIHEAGHAVASHVYMADVLSTRLSIRKRGGSLGHHQAIEKEERFSSWRHEEVGKLVWTLGAMAAEHVFYGENSTGVGGDVQSATSRAAWMVGMCGMGPEPIELNGNGPASARGRAALEDEIMERFERIGLQIMNRAAGMRESGDPIPSILGDPSKRKAAAQILGQAYLTAVCLVRHNREQVLRIADTLVARKELHGDEVVEVLDAADLEAPHIDVTDDSIWPKL